MDSDTGAALATGVQRYEICRMLSSPGSLSLIQKSLNDLAGSSPRILSGTAMRTRRA
jgi:hypothetical protein